MGLLSPRSSSSSTGTASTSELTAALSQLGFTPEALAAPAPEVPPQGIGGKLTDFVSNIGHDIADFGHGLSSIGGSVLHDIYNGMPGGPQNEPYRLPELAKQLVFDPETMKRQGISAAIAPGLQTYAEEAYGINPVKGDILPDIKKVGHSVYHHPLSTALDIYGASSLAGRGLSKLAGMEADAALEAGRPVSEFTKRVLPGMDPASPYFDPTGQISRGGVTRRLQEWGDFKVDLVPLSDNPVKRYPQTVWRKALTSDIERIPDNVKAMATKLEGMKSADAAVARQQLNALQPDLARALDTYEAAKNAGVTRLEHARVAAFRARTESSKLLSTFSAHGYTARNEDMRDVQRILEDNLTADELPQFYRVAQGLPLSTGQKVISAGRWEFENALNEVERLHGRVPEPFIEEARAKFTRLHEHRQGLIQERNQAMMDLEMDPAEKAQQLATIQHRIEATEHYGKMLSEYPNVLLAGERINGYSRALAELRWRWDDVVSEGIGRNLMGDYDEVVARTYGPLLVERKALRLPDGKFDIHHFDYDALAGDNPAYWKELAKEFDDNGLASPLYYPHVDPRKFSAGDFLLRRGRFMEAQAGKAPFKHNEYWNYVNEAYEMHDPIEAYARRIAHVRKIVEAQKLGERVVDIFGRKLGLMDELATGEVVLNPKMMKQMYRTRLEMDEAIAGARELGMTQERAFAEGISETTKKMAAEVEAGRLHEMTDVYAIPKAVADQLESFSKYQFGDMGRIWWDGPTNMWRSAVLAFSPRWIFNNLLGNVTFLKMQGGRLADVFRDAWSPSFRQAVDNFVDSLPEDVRATVREQINSGLFSETEQYRTRIAGAQNTLGGRVAAGYGESTAGRTIGKAREFMQQLNEHIEKSFRRASFARGLEREAARAGIVRGGLSFHTSLSTLDDIARSGLTEQSALRAVDEMNYFFNDYRKLSSFERNILKRFVAPFWSFYKHTAKLTLSYPFAFPERGFVLRQIGQVANEMDADLGLRPDWLQGAVPFGQGREGTTRFINTRGINPLEGFVDTVADPSTVFGLASPQVKSVMELAMGKDLLTGRPFTAPGTGGAFGSEDKYQVVFDENGNPTGVTDQPITVRPGPLEMLIRQFPQGDLVRDIGSWLPYPGNPTPYEVSRRYDTGEEEYIGGEPAQPRSLPQELGQFGGVSTTDVDLGNYQEQVLAGRRAALTQVLRALGVLPPAEE